MATMTKATNLEENIMFWRWMRLGSGIDELWMMEYWATWRPVYIAILRLLEW